MKNSEMYEIAQMAVLRDANVSFAEKLEIIRVLEEQRGLEAFREKQEAEHEE